MSFLVGENMVCGYGGADILHGCTVGVDPGEIAAVSYTHLTLPTTIEV